MDSLKEVKMETNNIFKIIEKIRGLNHAGADYTLHQYSDSTIEYSVCTDKEIVEFCNKLLNGDNEVYLTIGDVDFTTGGNCDGDELFPAIIKAVKLPNESYYLTTQYCEWVDGNYKRFSKEYIYCPNSPGA